MVTVETVREAFTRDWPTLQRITVLATRSIPPHKREDVCAHILALTWLECLKLIPKYKGDEKGLILCAHKFAIKGGRWGRRLSGETGHDTVAYDLDRRKFDPLDGAAPTPGQDPGRRDPACTAALRVDLADYLRGIFGRRKKVIASLLAGQSQVEITKETGQKHSDVCRDAGHLKRWLLDYCRL